MPWTPAISQSLMNRFHLRTNTFAGWAVQQPIPAMYSFHNTTEIRNLPLDAFESGLLDPILFDPLAIPGDVNRGASRIGVLGGRTLNHFPAREITFANSRDRYLRDPATKWFVLESTYRGRTLRSVYELQRDEDVEWEMKRINE